MKKRVLSLLCAFLFVVGISTPALASSGKISGVGLAQAKTIASFAMVFTISVVSTPGAETPMNTSAPRTISGKSPLQPLGLVTSAISSLTGFIPVFLPR